MSPEREKLEARAAPLGDTERADPRSAELDRLPLEAAFDLFCEADASVAGAVAQARAPLLALVERAHAALAQGGRLAYVGAGTSGRLGQLDASEWGPTFGTPPGRVLALVAGGPRALVEAVEGAEDDEGAGRAAVAAAGLGRGDLVLGISASARARYVHAALAEARARGASTALLACVPFEQAPDEADLSVRIPTGPEVLAGSTRLKAGTATKMALNLLSTLVNARLGRVHGNRMVALASRANAKLWERALAMVEELGRVDAQRARALLERAEGAVPLAIVMARTGLALEEARARLAAADGRLRRALGEEAGGS